VRTIKPMNREWFFAPFDEQEGLKDDFSSFETIEIPHNPVDIPFNNVDESITWGTFQYVRLIDVTEDMKARHVVLRFEGVGHQATVFINAKEVLKNHTGYLPFDVDLTPFLDGDHIRVDVICDTKEDPQVPPFGGVVDYLGYGGIYREVSMLVTDLGYIEDIFVEQYGKKEFKVHVKTSIEGGSLQLVIQDHEGKNVFHAQKDIQHETTSFQVVLETITRWDLNNPYLYQAVVNYDHHHHHDQLSTRFGLREAIFKRDGFYLNDQKIKLMGLNRHQSYPYVGYAMPKSAQIEDADLIKYDLGCQIVRTSHYPQSKHFLNRCDEIGLLVLEEIPGWQHIGDDVWKKRTIDNVDRMILRDRNHPSIVMWGVRINESPDDDALYQTTNAHAMALDPTRQRGGIRNFANSHFFEDVYTYNDFSHIGTNKGLEKKEKITKDVPYLITEFNGHMFPTKRYDDESHRIQHAKRHATVINEAMNPQNGISGAIGWCFADYNTHKEFGSGDKICYHGVMDMYRIPKMASYVYATQQDDVPILEVLSTMNLGDYPAGNLGIVTVLTNVDEVKVYKNDVFIKTFKPDTTHYPYLKHPPILIDDLIGETLMNQEKMTYHDAERTKRVLRAVSKYGNHLPLRYKLDMLFILKKYKKTYDDAVKLFYTYMTGWGSKHNVYRFEGYQQGQLVNVVQKEPVTSTDLILSHHGGDMKVEDTYDVKRFVVQSVDQHGEILPYASDVITIQTEGVLELIGPNKLSLLGGAIGFWVKAKTKGQGRLIIESEHTTIMEEVNVL